MHANGEFCGIHNTPYATIDALCNAPNRKQVRTEINSEVKTFQDSLQGNNEGWFRVERPV